MANPDFRAEAGGDQNGTASATVSFTGLTWAANDIICIMVATDGYVPTLSTANGFVIATDPQGNAASVTTNAGTPGTAECGLFCFWKRAVGANTTADPEPVIAAPTNSGTTWCLETNSYLGARTKGTPWHIITTAVVGTATATVAPPSVTPTLGSVLVMPCAASANDDQAFNAWTLTGAASPTGQIDTGWHSGSGSQCAFTGGRGGYASTGGARSGSTTFGASTKQAQFTMVMAALDEFELDEWGLVRPAMSAPVVQPLNWAGQSDEFPVTAAGAAPDDDAPMPQLRSSAPPQLIVWAASDELPGTAASGPPDEDGLQVALSAAPAVTGPRLLADDDFPGTAPTPVDEDAGVSLWAPPPPVLGAVPPAPDELAGIAQPTGIDEDATLLRPLLVAAPAVAVPQPQADELPTTTTSGIGGAGDMQRSLSQPNQTGTLTTVAPVPAWTTSLTVVVDPSQGGTNRVTNGGNLYQARQNGTTASSGGGPTGTGAAINDGTTQWYYIGPAQGTNTVAGSQILCSVMRGTQSLAASIDPTDNDTGAYTVITNNAYANFTASFAGVWRRNTAANNKTNFQTSGVWGGSGGAGDEMSICWVELQGVAVGAPHTFSQVERLSATGGLGGTVTAAAITTTVPCIIVSFWFGNGNVQSTGVPDAATPAGGLTLIAGATGPLSLTPNGYIQHMVAWRRQSTPGTFAEVWTASPTDEGAQLVTVAFQDLSSPTLGVDDDPPMVSVRASVWVVPAWVAPADELPVTVPLDDDGASMVRISAPPVGLVSAAAGDDLAVTTVEDDPQLVVGVAPVVSPVLVLRTDDEMPPVAVADEDTPLPILAAPVAVPTVQRTEAEELPVTAASVVVDEDGLLAPAATPSPPPPAPRADSDELPLTVASAIVDEDGQLSVLSPRPPPPLTFPVQIDEFILAAAAQLDEDSQIALLLSAAAAPPAYPPAADEVLPTALDDSTPLPAPLTPPPTFTLRLVLEDEFQGVSVPPPVAMIDEDGQLPPPPLAPPPPLWQLLAVDELSIPLSIPSLPKHVRILSAAGPAVVIANNAPTVVIVKVLNE